jgi:glycosyltransferase involved in cell wall biosynthesis
MKVLLLADIGSSHTEKWAFGLASKGITVGLFSLNKPGNKWFEGVENIKLIFYPNRVLKGNKLSEKLGYVRFLPILKKKIKEFQPTILHAHYASSYGFIGALTRFHPFAVSVWGSDVYDFPKKNWINRAILRFTLSKAQRICSTSYSMKEETLKYTNKHIHVIPFGIDVNLFQRLEDASVLDENKKIVVGNIKSLEDKYGIDTLILAFRLFDVKFPEVEKELLIVGEGTKRKDYEALVHELNLVDKVVFTGKVNHSDVPNYHRRIDIFVCLSKLNSESFGVSLVEALSCRSVVIASKVDGFREVLDDSNTYGYLVEKNNPEQVAELLGQIILNKKSAMEKTIKGREHILNKYHWRENLNLMITVYNEMIP